VGRPRRLCERDGRISEKLFQQIAERRGWTTRFSTKEQNLYDHWDIAISKDNQIYKVDVKSRKTTREVDEEWVWIEFIGITGETGWLYGNADLFAFERIDCFLIVNKKKLIALTKDKVDFNRKANNSSDAKYCLYTRKGRNDLLTKVEVYEIEKIATVWSK